MNKYFAPNNGRFKILTDKAFSDFLGVTKTENSLTVKEITLDNSAIITTIDHCIFVDTINSIEMGKIGIGDKVLYNGDAHTVVSVRYKDTNAVYDVLEVEKNHRFYVKSLNH